MAQWYVSVNGQQQGPLSLEDARSFAARNPEAHAWTGGMSQWLPVSQIDTLRSATPVSQPPSPPLGGWGGTAGQRADEVDYEIIGSEMQFVEIELDPGESAVAEAGAMMYKHPSIQMQTIFGDGSRAEQNSGFMSRLLGAGKRLLTGEGLFTTVFTHNGVGKARVAFAAPFPGNIVALPLSQYGGRVICQKDSFLCAARGVSIGIHFQRRILTGLFGGEGFIMQKLEGDGLAFVHAGGTVVKRTLQAGEELHVDTGCVVAYTGNVDFTIQTVGGVKSALFGGEGLFFAVLRGPGQIWLQSLPFSRLAARMLQGATGARKEEGSILGGFGNRIDGDGR